MYAYIFISRREKCHQLRANLLLMKTWGRGESTAINWPLISQSYMKFAYNPKIARCKLTMTKLCTGISAENEADIFILSRADLF